MKFQLKLPQTEVKTVYDGLVKQEIQRLSIKGFRKGKAPRRLAEPLLDKSKLFEAVFNRLLPPKYSQYLKKHQLHPITRPKIEIKNMELNSDWLVDVEIAEKPEVDLGAYESAVKKLNRQLAKAKKPDESKQVNEIYGLLQKIAKVAVPGLLIDEAVQYSLAKLADQVTKLGLSLDQYLESMKKTYADLRREYVIQAEADLKLEFCLEKIAQEKKLMPQAADIKKVIAGIKDPQTRAFVEKDQDTQFSLYTSLMRTNVVNYLKAL
jgi:FKBP-type peptidyl-prolyl cis-trans isomerase (trigger factor)